MYKRMKKYIDGKGTWKKDNEEKICHVLRYDKEYESNSLSSTNLSHLYFLFFPEGQLRTKKICSVKITMCVYIKKRKRNKERKMRY